MSSSWSINKLDPTSGRGVKPFRERKRITGRAHSLATAAFKLRLRTPLGWKAKRSSSNKLKSGGERSEAVRAKRQATSCKLPARPPTLPPGIWSSGGN